MNSVKALVLILFCCMAVVSGQKKTLDLASSVANAYNMYYPQKWWVKGEIPNSHEIYYVDYFAAAPTLNILDLSTGKLTWSTTVADFSKTLGVELQGFPEIHFINENEAVLNTGTQLVLWNRSESASVITASKEWENIEYANQADKAAFTEGNNVKVFVNNEVKTVTNHTDKNITAGQSIHRNEFGISKGLFWADNGKYLAFYEKDESEVGNYPLLDINSTPGSLKEIKYPMAGQGSEKAKIGIYNVETDKVVYLNIEGPKDQYLTNFTFNPSATQAYVAIVNRGQNKMKLNVYDVNSGAFVKTILEEEDPQYVEPENPPFFLNDNEMIWISDREGYDQLYYYDLLKGKSFKLFNVDKDVLTIEAYNGEEKDLYFTATGHTAMSTALYSINLKKQKVNLIGEDLGQQEFLVSDDFTYVLNSYTRTDVPRVIQSIDLEEGTTQNIFTAQDPLADYQMPNMQTVTIKAADGMTDLYGRLITPSNLDSNKKYPVFVYLYGGPHAQLVTNSYLGGSSLWLHQLAEEGYIVFTIDNRGSAHRGANFEQIIHGQLGEIEMLDQLEGVNYLKSLPFVDETRMAVHGWSFGGYMATSFMLKNPGVFKVGIAGGPVTDWKYYEVMYGERYMDTPQENPEGYELTSLLNKTQNLEGELLLIHGTVDDVVVMQHNLALVQSFIKAGKLVDFFPYPMHKHNVYGQDRVHLIRKIVHYFKKNI